MTEREAEKIAFMLDDLERSADAGPLVVHGKVVEIKRALLVQCRVDKDRAKTRKLIRKAKDA